MFINFGHSFKTLYRLIIKLLGNQTFCSLRHNEIETSYQDKGNRRDQKKLCQIPIRIAIEGVKIDSRQ